MYYAADSVVCHVHDESFTQIYRRYKREAIAYMSMFDIPRHSVPGLFPRYAVSVLRDLHYGVRNKASLGRLLQVPATRLAFYLGMHAGERAKRASSDDSLRDH